MPAACHAQGLALAASSVRATCLASQTERSVPPPCLTFVPCLALQAFLSLSCQAQLSQALAAGSVPSTVAAQAQAATAGADSAAAAAVAQYLLANCFAQVRRLRAPWQLRQSRLLDELLRRIVW